MNATIKVTRARRRCHGLSLVSSGSTRASSAGLAMSSRPVTSARWSTCSQLSMSADHASRRSQSTAASTGLLPAISEMATMRSSRQPVAHSASHSGQDVLRRYATMRPSPLRGDLADVGHSGSVGRLLRRHRAPHAPLVGRVAPRNKGRRDGSHLRRHVEGGARRHAVTPESRS